MQIRQFDVREADWTRDGEQLSEIRRIVFIVGQSVPKEEEWDGRDEASWHWLATDHDGKPIGTARLLPEGQIGRMAVIDEWRGAGVGAAMLEAAVEKARHLGFTEVFLNAQTHALGFYEKSGFVADGDEFMEADIPHRRMTKTLAPKDDHASRFAYVGEAPSVSLRQFDAAEVDWATHGKIIRKLREAVLVRELGLEDAMVADVDDDSAIHWHARTADGETIGAVRMSTSGIVSRLVVTTGHRREGVGQALLELAESKARRFGLAEISLQALTALDAFYRRAGFEPRGEAYMAQGHEHREYAKPLVYENVFDRTRSPLHGDEYGDGDSPWRLGEDNRLLLLRREEEFRNVIIEMCRQANQTIRIYSPLLEHKLFDSPQLREICSALARRNKYTKIEILIYDSHRVVKNGHALLEIARKLPSSIGMKIVDPELRQLNHEYVLADDAGLIYRHDNEAWDGYANFYEKTESNRLGRAFTAAWESGLIDPNLRVLRI
ncbi:MAG: GNAT family N-acetyltransferase [Pseudomonadales bacterium]|nr:GNAT family N-acetyltransferase [Pseudomonadales bacterium]